MLKLDRLVTLVRLNPELTPPGVNAYGRKQAAVHTRVHAFGRDARLSAVEHTSGRMGAIPG